MRAPSLRRVIGRALQEQLHLQSWQLFGESPKFISPSELEQCIKKAINTVYVMCQSNGIQVDRASLIRIAKSYLRPYIIRVKRWKRATCSQCPS